MGEIQNTSEKVSRIIGWLYENKILKPNKEEVTDDICSRFRNVKQ